MTSSQIEARLIRGYIDVPTALCVASIMSAALLLRLVPMLAWPSVSRPDEVFQALEPAHRLLTGWGIVSWEWRDGIRSWLFPGGIAGVMVVARAAGLGTGGTLAAVASAMAALSLVPVVIGLIVGRRQAGLPGAVLIGTLCAAWPDLAYYGPRTLAEVQGAHFLLLAAGLTALSPRRADSDQASTSAAIGFALGLTFCIRFHLLPAILLVAAWRCRSSRRHWGALLLGASMPVLALGALDWWSWGKPFQSVWKNILINVVQGRSLHYGTSPIWWYGDTLRAYWGVAVMPLAVCFVIGARRQPLLAWLAGVVIASHMLLAHKEISFVYAAIPAILIVAGCGSCDLLVWLADWFRRPSGQLLIVGTLAWSIVAAFVASSGMWRSRWEPSGPLWAEAALRRQADLCGLGLYRVVWAVTGGYSYLDRAVPISLIDGPSELAQARNAVNYIIAPVGIAVPSFSMLTCRYDVCLLHSFADCSGPVVFGTDTDLIRRSE
jgi:GPI mannosyltransferase 3